MLTWNFPLIFHLTWFLLKIKFSLERELTLQGWLMADLLSNLSFMMSRGKYWWRGIGSSFRNSAKNMFGNISGSLSLRFAFWVGCIPIGLSRRRIFEFRHCVWRHINKGNVYPRQSFSSQSIDFNDKCF